MRVITLRETIRSVPDRWDSQYLGYDLGSDKMQIARDMRKLDLETATAADVARIIGNDLWTNLRCYDCDKSGLDWIVEVGQAPDYESSTTWLCRQCARKVAMLADEVKPCDKETP